MNTTAIALLVIISNLTSFIVGYMVGKASPTDDRHGHPYDLDE